MSVLSNAPLRNLGGVVQTPALGFGCMSLTPGFYGEDMDITETEKTLRKALDLGVTLLDTADFYTSMTSGALYQNIKLIGKVMKDYPREKVIIAMKIGPWIEGGFKPYDLGLEAMTKRTDEALSILGTSYIDFLIYRKIPMPDKSNTSMESLATTLKSLVDAGKVKAVGVSEVSVEEFKAIHNIVPVKLVELEWSLFSRDTEADIIPLARECGTGILAYSPMGRGVLTGKHDPNALEKGDFRHHNSRTSGKAMDNNMKLVKLVGEMAEGKGCTTGQLALAWVLAQGEDVVPIPGTKRIPYLEENLKAIDVKLTKEEVQKLRDLVPTSEVAGSRY